MKKEFHASLIFRKNEGDLHEIASSTGLKILRIWKKGDILPSKKKRIFRTVSAIWKMMIFLTLKNFSQLLRGSY